MRYKPEVDQLRQFFSAVLFCVVGVGCSSESSTPSQSDQQTGQRKAETATELSHSNLNDQRPSTPITELTALTGSDFEGGCGCSVLNAKGETILFSSLKKGSPLIAKPNGVRREFMFISSDEKPIVDSRREPFTRVYQQGADKISLEFNPAKSCVEGMGDCESQNFENSIKIESHDKEFKMIKLKGDCGC